MEGFLAGQMSFLLRASAETLPTSLNLRQRMDHSCPLCSHNQPTIHHVVFNCSEALQQGRHTWWHDWALQTLLKSIKKHLDSETILYADLSGMRANENPVSTILEVVLVTSAHLNIVLVGEGEVTLIELTIPHNSLENLSNASDHKSQKEIYLQALSDLEAKAYKYISYRLAHLNTGF